MVTRRDVLLGAVACPFAPSLLRCQPQALLSAQDEAYLRELAQATITRATREESLQHVGFAIVSPGGNYPSYWIRDFSMAAGCGLIPATVLRDHLLLALKTQRGPVGWKLQSGGYVPPWSIADHVRFEGQPVYYPGTLSPGEDQGGGAFGFFPPVDDHFEVVHIAWCLAQRGKTDFLHSKIEGVSVFDRLVHAVKAPRIDAKTGLVVTDSSRRAVGFGFCDAIVHTGELLFASLLRERAMVEMADLATSIGESSAEWSHEADRIRRNLVPTFLKDGWLVASTGKSSQPDVWGSAFAVYRGVLDRKTERTVVDTLIDAYQSQTITWKGAVRHVPTVRDFSEQSAWEESVSVPKNRYQNGAYWHVPTGWLAKALTKSDLSLGRRLVAEMIAHFKDEDFRNGGGAPWECVHSEENYRQNAIYLVSVTLPFEVLTQ